MNGATVHIVDDDDAVRDSLKMLLDSYGLDVRDYGSAAEFLAEETASPRGCLILDVHLPVLSGTDLMAILRQRGMALPTIFITGRSDKETKERALQAGAVAFLEKPVGEEALLEAIRSALARSGARYDADAGVNAQGDRQAPAPS